MGITVYETHFKHSFDLMTTDNISLNSSFPLIEISNVIKELKSFGAEKVKI